jgi:hypothetical protein
LEYPEIFFAVVDKSTTRRRPKCVACEQTRRDEIKRKNRWRHKACGTLRRHAKKYGMKPVDFAKAYDWNINRMAHEAEYFYGNGCQECGRKFSEMGNGLWDITLDIYDKRNPPVYGTNTRWICQTDNREKGTTPPELWGIKRMCWRQWEERMEQLNHNPLLGLPLFEYGKALHVSSQF